MKHILALALVLASPIAAGPAFAQTKAQPAAGGASQADAAAKVEEACTFIAKSLLMVDTIKVGIVQAFPELDPPGARMTYSTRMDAEPGDITDEIECQFTENAGKLEILRFCADSTCYASDSEDLEDRRRFVEMQTLIKRPR